MTKCFRSLASLLLVAVMLASALAAQAQSTEAVVTSAVGESDAQVEPLTAEELASLAKQRQAVFYSEPPTIRVRRYMKAAGDKMGEGEIAEAQRLLKRLNMNRLNAAERSSIYRLLGFLSYQLGDQEQALGYFEQAIAEQAMLLPDEVSIMFYVVQLRAALEDWPGVIVAMDRWRQFVPAPTGLSYYLRAVAYYQMDDYENALVNAEKAVEAEPEPLEPWLQLLAALYVLNEDYASVTPVLEELVARYPKKSYWIQLSLIYGASDEYEKSLSVQQLAYLQGYLTEDRELTRLARSYVFAGLPYDAARILEDGLKAGTIEPKPKTYELLANSWIQAREFDRSLEPLLKAAELSEDGNLYVRLGQVYMARDEWGQATEYFQKAIEKGGLKKPGNAVLLLGITYYNSDQLGRARSMFARARKYEKARKAANDWLTHIDKESQQG